MQYPQFFAGQPLTAGQLQAAQTQTLLQALDQPVSNATTGATLVDATDLGFTAAANATYRIDLYATYSGATTGDIAFNWRGPTGLFLQRWILGLTAAVTSQDAASVIMRRRSGTVSSPGATATADFNDYYETVIARTVAAGDIWLQFAQGTATATATTLRADSMIEYRRIA